MAGLAYCKGLFSRYNSETESATTVENIEAAKELVEEIKDKGVDTSLIECQILIATK